MKFSAPIAIVVRRVSGNPAATELFNGKTVAQVFNENKMLPADITIGLPEEESGDDALGFLFKIGTVKWYVSLSKALKAANDEDTVLDDSKYFWRCEFRESSQAVRDKDGKETYDGDGNVLLSTTNKVVTLGKPSGAPAREVAAFDEEDPAANSTPAEKDATAKVG